ncbi:unnamed protein product [Gordionus sp. m RMFG-2023]|uniref:uncharacterized protein LOC135929114 n=1 Tax=Gordionus sp. m RMFG-2023 TaxID=3053472 RepID=UPI0030E5D57D
MWSARNRLRNKYVTAISFLCGTLLFAYFIILKGSYYSTSNRYPSLISVTHSLYWTQQNPLRYEFNNNLKSGADIKDREGRSPHASSNNWFLGGGQFSPLRLLHKFSSSVQSSAGNSDIANGRNVKGGDFIDQYDFKRYSSSINLSQVAAAPHPRFPYEPQNQSPASSSSLPSPKTYKWKILCWVLTNPANLRTRTVYVKRSWGPRCDLTLYLSTFSDPDFPTIGLLDRNQTSSIDADTKKKDGKKSGSTKGKNSKSGKGKIVESKQLNSEKARMAWTYIYENHYKDFDFFYKTDDDTYVIVENLRDYLETKDPNQPEFYGHRFILRGKNVTYMSGGSGFILTKRAVELLVTYSFKRYPTCIPKGAGEDWKTARCLEMAGCKAVDTRDHLGRERFLVFPPKSHLAGTYPAWYYKYDVDGSVKGIGCCSYYPISFHYIRGTELLMIDYFLYRMRVLGDENFWDNYVPGLSKDIIDPTSSPPSITNKLKPNNGTKNAIIEKIHKPLVSRKVKRISQSKDNSILSTTAIISTYASPKMLNSVQKLFGVTSASVKVNDNHNHLKTPHMTKGTKDKKRTAKGLPYYQTSLSSNFLASSHSSTKGKGNYKDVSRNDILF